jgi:acyl-CoA synthetase (AMP-forming)/AMP-acid ligase II
LSQEHSPFLKTRFPDLRYITNSGGRLPEPLVRAIRASHPHVAIYLMYGLTEAFRSTYLSPDEVDARPSSIGRAIPNVEILVVNDDGQPCRPGEVGELVHRGATVGMGYWRDPQSTAKAFRPHPLEHSRHGKPEIVVYSGDLVKTDADGYLYYVGRRDQLIKSSGFRVSPDEVEAAIFASGLVVHVVAFAAPRTDAEDQIVAAVVPREASEFREEQLRQYCKAEMPEYMQPRVIWRLDQFPLTTSGKPDRPRIKAAYLEASQPSSAVA